LARLLDLFGNMAATREQVAARMLACQNVLTTFIGELDGRPIGSCLRLIPHRQGDEPYAELTDIYVDAAFRRQGVARALIAHVEAAAPAAGAGGLVIISGFENAGALILPLMVKLVCRHMLLRTSMRSIGADCFQYVVLAYTLALLTMPANRRAQIKEGSKWFDFADRHWRFAKRDALLAPVPLRAPVRRGES